MAQRTFFPAVALAAGLLVLTSACGSGSDDAEKSSSGKSSSPSPSPTASPSTPSPTSSPTTVPPTPKMPPAAALPDCAKVWRENGRLPVQYRGCNDQGKVNKRNGQLCESGQFLVTFKDRYWAVQGGVIAPMSDKPAYNRVKAACLG